MVLEHAAHFRMVKREFLSILHCCYQYVQKICPQHTDLWVDVREEVETFQQVMVLARPSWTGGCDVDVNACDASLDWVWHQVESW